MLFRSEDWPPGQSSPVYFPLPHSGCLKPVKPRSVKPQPVWPRPLWLSILPLASFGQCLQTFVIVSLILFNKNFSFPLLKNYFCLFFATLIRAGFGGRISPSRLRVLPGSTSGKQHARLLAYGLRTARPPGTGFHTAAGRARSLPATPHASPLQ